MPRFRFRLESLLKLRRTEEDRARAGFLRELRKVRLKEAEILETIRRREEAKARAREDSAGDKETGAIDMEVLLRGRRYINFLYERIVEKRGELASLRPSLEEARGAYRRAVMRRSAVEKLRAARLQEHRREEERRERRELDEVGVVGFIRARTDGDRPEAGAER